VNDGAVFCCYAGGIVLMVLRDGIAKRADMMHALNLNLNQMLHLDTIEPAF
jgi:hypothetical protein